LPQKKKGVSYRIQTEIITGDVGGFKRVEIPNWSGSVIMGDREDLEAVTLSDEAKRVGVYILIGWDSETGNRKAYVGQSKQSKSRLEQQLAKKQFWTEVILVTTISESCCFTEGHSKYLEGRLIEEVHRAGRYSVDNGQNSGSTLSEMDRIIMEEFLDRLRSILYFLARNLVLPNPDLLDTYETDTSLFRVKVNGIRAFGKPTDSGFLVKKGSQAMKHERSSVQRVKPSISDRRQEMLDADVLLKQNGYLEFTCDVEFTSPTIAGEVIYGGTAQGPKIWKDMCDRSLIDRGWVDIREQRRQKFDM
jgi:hypothetical protein